MADTRLAHQRECYERLLQQSADLLAQERRTVATLRQTSSTTDNETGLRRTRDQVISARHAQKVAEAALRAGIPPIGKKAPTPYMSVRWWKICG